MYIDGWMDINVYRWMDGYEWIQMDGWILMYIDGWIDMNVYRWVEGYEWI